MDAIALGLSNNLSIETKRARWNLPKGPKFRVGQSAISAHEGKIYVSGSNQSESQSRLQIFNPQEQTWEELNLPAVYRNHTQVTLGQFIYFVANEASTSQHHRYDTVAKSFITRTAPIQPLYAGTAEANPDLGVYNLFGGENSGYRAENQQFNPATNTWTYRASMPIPARWVNAHYYDGNFYVWGGFNGSYPRQVQIYNPTTNLWSYGPNDAPTNWSKDNTSGSVRFGNKVYQKSTNSIIYIFDLETLTFQTKNHTYGGQTNDYSLGAAMNRKLYWVGSNGGYYWYQTVEYDPFADEWTGLRENDNLYGHAMATDHLDKIWVYTGRSGVSSFSSASYQTTSNNYLGRVNLRQYTISTDTWTNLADRPTTINGATRRNADTHEFLLYIGSITTTGLHLFACNSPQGTNEKQETFSTYLRYTISTNTWATDQTGGTGGPSYGITRHTPYTTDPITGEAWQAGGGYWSTTSTTTGHVVQFQSSVKRMTGPTSTTPSGADIYSVDQYIGASMGAYRNKILFVYALGVSNQAGIPASTCTVRNQALGVTTTVQNIPIPVAYAQYATVNDKVYILGGATNNHWSSFPSTDIVQVFDLLSFEWSTAPRLPRPLAYGHAVGVGNKIYLYGGYNQQSGTVSNQIIVYDTEESERIVGIENLKNYLLTV
jgi:N-acetylneuraminic acid mutarotase